MSTAAQFPWATPVGCSGAHITATLLYEMQKRPETKCVLATLCIDGGMGTAAVFQKF
jgi:acetyl-CoA C-acetyltransferase